MAKQTKPILDTTTGEEYSSMYQAGKALGTTLVPDYKGEPRLIWFAMVRAFPTRFQTRSTSGQWVALNDPSVPKITRVRKTETPEQAEIRLKAELYEIQQRKAALAGVSGGTAVAAKSPGAKAAAAKVEALTEVEEEVEGADAEEAAPVAAKPKLAGAMKKSA